MTRHALIGLIVLFCAGAAGAQTQTRTRPVSADFVAPGPVVPLDASLMNAVGALRAGSLASHIALHLDWTDGKSGGSDYRAFARKGRPFVRFFGNYFDGYHESIDTIERLNPAQVLRMARLALASAWLFADR